MPVQLVDQSTILEEKNTVTIEERAAMEDSTIVIEQGDRKIGLDWLGLTHLTEVSRETYGSMAEDKDKVDFEAASREFVEALNERGYVIAREPQKDS